MSVEIAKGATWMVVFRLLDRSIGIISTAILARLLVPNDFGLVAMAMSVIVFIELSTSFGFELALIQMRDPAREHFDTAWTLNLCIAVAGAFVTALAAYPAAMFYGDLRLLPVMLAIGAAWLISGFENIGTVNFRREMDFATEFRFMAIKRLTAFVVTVSAALLLKSYWALVIGSATGRVTGVALSYMMHPYRPRLSLSRTRDLFSFSGWIFVNNLLGVAFSRIPHFVVGRAFGGPSLGMYTVASEIAQLAQTELIAPINRAMFPGYSRMASDMPLFRKTAIDATAAILLIALPVSVGIAVLAGPFVRLLLGPQWADAVPIIQVLAVAATVSAITSNNVSIYLALGRPRLVSATLAARLVALSAGMIWIGTEWQVVGIAYAELLAALASLSVSLPTLFNTIGLRVREYAAIFWRPITSSALMGYSIAVAVQPGFAADAASSAIFELFAGLAIGGVVYPLSTALLWRVGRRADAIELRIYRLAIARLRGYLLRRGI